MSKRARITLNPEIESEPAAEPEPTLERETPRPAQRGFSAAASRPSKPAGASASAPASVPANTPNRHTIVKLALAGLAVASVVLLWVYKRR